MPESSSHSLPPRATLDELVKLFDTHDMGDYLEDMPEVEFTVNLKSKKHLVALEGEIAVRLTEIARTQQVSAEALVNSWLKEKISNLPEERKGAS
jgi:hypothetical protein